MQVTTFQKWISYLINESTSPNFDIALFLISNIQISFLVLIFVSHDIPDWNSTFILNFSKIFTVDCKYQEITPIYHFIYITSLAYVILLFGWNIIVGVLVYRGVELKQIKKYSQIINSIHFSVLFQPIVSIFNYIFIMKSQNTFSDVMNIPKANEDLYFIISVIILALNFIFGILCSLYSFNSEFGHFAARLPSGIEFFRLFLKAGFLIEYLTQMKDYSSSNTTVVLMILAVESIVSLIIGLNCPDFNKRFSKLRCAFLSFNLALIGVYFLREKLYETGVTLTLSGVLGFLLLLYLFDLIVELKPEILFDDVRTNILASKAIRKLSFMLEILTFDPSKEIYTLKKSTNYVLFMGLLKTHRSTCIKQNCFCKVYDIEGANNININHIVKSYNEFVDDTILDYCMKLINSTKHNFWLKIIHSRYMIMSRPHLFPKALFLLTTIKAKDFFINLTKTRVFEEIKTMITINSINSKQEVDIKSFLDYKIESDKFKILLKKGVEKSLKFWSDYDHDNPVFHDIYNQGKDCNLFDDKLTSAWRHLYERFRVFLVEDLLNYASFKIIIMNNKAVGNKLIKIYKQKIENFVTMIDNHIITNTTLVDVKNLFVSVRMDRERLGLISEVKGDLMGTLGYTVKDVLGNNVSTIVPKYVENHDSYLRNHLEYGGQTMLYKNRNLYAQHKNGHIVPIYAYICASPNIQHGLSYITIIRPYKKFQDVVVFRKNGTLISATFNILRSFGLLARPSFEDFKIWDFCHPIYNLLRIIETYEWIDSNITEEDKKSFEVMNIRMRSKIINSSEETNVILPEKEEEYKNLLKIYDQVNIEGLILEVSTVSGPQKFTCLINSDPSFKERNVRSFFFMKNEVATSEGRTRREVVPHPNVIKKSVKNIINLNQTLSIFMRTDNLNTSKIKNFKKKVSKNRSFSLSQSQNITHGDMNFLPHKDYESISSIDNFEYIDDQIDLEKEENEEAEANNGRNLRLYTEMNTRILNDLEEMEKVSLRTSQQESENEYIHQSNIILGMVGQMGVIETASSKMFGSESSRTTRRTDFRRVESKVYTAGDDKPIKYFGCSLQFFYLTIIVSWFYFYFYSYDKVEVLNITLEGLDAASKRYQTFLRYNQAVRKIDSLHHDVLNPEYTGELEIYLQSQKKIVLDSVIALQSYRDAIIKTYAVLDPDDILEIMAAMNLYPPETPDKPLTVSLEEAFSLLGSLGLIIGDPHIADTDFYQDQVLNYVLDDLIIRSYDMLQIFNDHLNERIDAIQIYLKDVVIAKIIIIISLYSAFILLNIRNNRYQNIFMESLIKVEETKFYPQIGKIESFSQILAEDFKAKIKSSISMKSQTGFALPKQSKGKKNRRRRFSPINIFLTSSKRLVALGILFAIILLGSIVFYLKVQDLTEKIRAYTQDFIYVSNIAGECNLIIIGIDNYILEENDTLRGNDISSELWADVNYVLSNLQFYQNLYQNDISSPKINEIVKANICERYASSIKSQELCQSIGEGSLRYGVSGMMNVIHEFTKQILKAYDNSDKSEEAKEKIYMMKEYYDLSDLARYFIDLPFDEILGIINEGVDKNDSDNQTFIITMDLVFLFVTAIIGYLSYLIYTHLKTEKLETRRILRLMPCDVIVEHPLICRFL